MKNQDGELVIGVDVGTSGVKALLAGADGSVLRTAEASHGFATPRPLWAESDPGDWWEGVVAALSQLLEGIDRDRLRAVGLTGQMHGLVALDRHGRVVCPCIMWNDQRTGEECREIEEEVGVERLIERSGNRMLAGFTAPKVRWLRKHRPDVYQEIARVLLPKDYIRYRLSGVFATDVADASGTGMLDVGRRTWCGELVAAAGAEMEWLPEVVESAAVAGCVSAAVAAATGLPEGLPIVAGAGDQAAGAVGCGIVREGRISVTLGTSGVVFAHSETFQSDPGGRLHAFCHAVPGKWHLMGVMLSAAGSYQWLADKVFPGLSFRELDDLAAKAPAGCEGLAFMPYLAGERCPHADPLAKGGFVGLTLRHGREHIARAVLEGVAFGLRDSLELMRPLGIRASEVVATGGGVASPLWRSILADVLGCELTVPATNQGGAHGAALLAAVGAGLQRDVEAACAGVLDGASRVAPDPAGSETMERHYQKFCMLYPACRELFHKPD